jgi:hypothetical protein
MTAIVLFSIAFVLLVGYVLYRKRTQNDEEPVVPQPVEPTYPPVLNWLEFKGNVMPEYGTPEEALVQPGTTRSFFTHQPLQYGTMLYHSINGDLVDGGSKWIALTDESGTVTAVKVASTGRIISVEE